MQDAPSKQSEIAEEVRDLSSEILHCSAAPLQQLKEVIGALDERMAAVERILRPPFWQSLFMLKPSEEEKRHAVKQADRFVEDRLPAIAGLIVALDARREYCHRLHARASDCVERLRNAGADRRIELAASFASESAIQSASAASYLQIDLQLVMDARIPAWRADVASYLQSGGNRLDLLLTTNAVRDVLLGLFLAACKKTLNRFSH